MFVFERHLRYGIEFVGLTKTAKEFIEIHGPANPPKDLFKIEIYSPG
jgi:hypothetical protein